MANTSPSEVLNTGDTFTTDSTIVIGSDNLLYGDPEQPDSEILFTVTEDVGIGSLRKGGVGIGVGASFTQDDLDAGLITYASVGRQTAFFGFQVTDGAGGYVGGKRFSFTWNGNSPPVKAKVATLTVAPDQAVTLSSSNLLFGDAEQPDNQITYTITRAATGGTLSNNGVALGVGGTFTQADIDMGRIAYADAPGGSASDSFGFQVSDGHGGVVSGQELPISVGGTAPSFPSTFVVQEMSATRGTAGAYMAPLNVIGDVNGDGYVDINSGRIAGNTSNRESYFLFGSASGFVTPSNYPSLTRDQGFAVANSHDQGIVSGALGDINGDGIADFGIGPIGHYGFNGPVTVIFGIAGGPMGTINQWNQDVVNLDNVPSARGFKITAPTNSSTVTYLGASAGIGDINGDGKADFTVSANGASFLGHTYGGAIYVFYGKTTGYGTASGGSRTFSLDNFTASDGFILVGPPYERINDVYAIGDINGDGYRDFAVRSSQSYVVFGGPNTPGTLTNGQNIVDLVNLTPAQGFVLDMTVKYRSFANAGDLNGDAIEDLVIGTVGNTSTPGAYVLFGTRGDIANEPLDKRGRTVVDPLLLNGTNGFRMISSEANDNFGQYVRGGRDLNGDGIADIQVDAPTANGGVGRTYTIYGKPGPTTTQDAEKILDEHSSGLAVSSMSVLDPAAFSQSHVTPLPDYVTPLAHEHLVHMAIV